MALNAKVSAQGYRNVFTDGKPQTDAISVETPILSYLSEWREELVQALSGYANTRIFYWDVEHVCEIIDLSRDRHESMLGVLNSIREQVNEDLLDPVWVCLQPHG